MGRKAFLAALLVAGAAALAFAFRPQPIAVSVAEVTRGPLRVSLVEEGRTRVRDRFVVRAPVTADAPRIGLREGDTVNAGETLLRLRPVAPMPLDARTWEQAKAQVAEARAAYEFARSELTRTRILFERGDVSESALREAESLAGQTRARLLAAGAVLQLPGATEAGGEVPVTAPVAGRVLAVHHQSAGVVTAGESLLTLADTGALEVAVDTLSEDAVRLTPGMRVLFERWGRETPLEGQVRTIEPSAFTKVSALGVEEQRVWVIADITSPPEQWRDLGDGYRVEARFILWEQQAVLQVPASALFRDGEGWAAFVVAAGRAERRTVEIGQRGELQVQVVAGLAPGERVITHPDSELTDGARVALREAGR